MRGVGSRETPRDLRDNMRWTWLTRAISEINRHVSLYGIVHDAISTGVVHGSILRDPIQLNPSAD